MAAKRAKTSKGKARKVQERTPAFQGWQTTDDDELQRRRWRGLTDIAGVESLEPGQPYFGAFRVSSTGGGAYDVEIRSLTERENSCGCADWRVNGLGTCKHIEGALEALRRRGKRAFEAAALTGSPRVEIFPAVDGSCAVQVRRPRRPTELDALLDRRRGPDRTLAGDPLTAVANLRKALRKAPEGPVRLSRHLDARLEEERRRRRRIEERERFEADVTSGKATIGILHHPLLPYQVEGMLHLAFGERALLADEMGLGKTVQAIAACELLRRLRGIGRVLVVLPASLKAEWEDQIARFSDLSVTVVSGPRAERLRLYTAQTFFILVNYEQVLIDRDDINRIVGPDVVILDEAQRIKNWQTKTAQAVKGLASPYAFVLTGTPLENRIDEVYSIVQYLDPRLLGPLFRFNRDFYVLDERGRPTDYKNLEELRRRLAPVMLRRRKDEVEDELPGRTVDTFFVAMTDEQRLRYADYEGPANRLIHLARRRPLLKAEFDRLMVLLACMRMICDTPYILDPDCRISPKLDELENILGDLLAEPGRKVIVFSEWERMLELVRELAVEMGFEFSWHTGSVPQDKRRAEIRRFKNDPTCRLFLSTDSGSVGLNLQAASAVINMDLPWNPAKLEQRIARAWRKHQTRTVSVINLVCEDSIEHKILHLLSVKQGLADGVLDGRGDMAALKMPSGRAAMIERMAGLLQAPEPTAPALKLTPVQRVSHELVERLEQVVVAVERRRNDDGGDTLIAVLDLPAAEMDDERQRIAGAARQAGIASVEIVDRATWNAVRRLAAAGIVRLAEPDEVLHRAAGWDTVAARDDREKPNPNRQIAQAWLAEADRKLRMATLLADGGFGRESLPPLGEVASLAIRGLAIVADSKLEPARAETLSGIELAELATVRALLPPGSIAHLASMGGTGDSAQDIDACRVAAQGLLAAARSAVGL